MASVVLKGVSKAYGGSPPIVRDIDLDITEGEFCVFLGASGCGKSTLLRMIAGLEDVTDGDIYIGSQRMNLIPPARRGVAMVFQSYALFPHMTVYENLSFGLTLSGIAKATVREKFSTSRTRCRSSTCWTARLERFPAASDSALQSDAPSSASPVSFYSMSRFPIWTQPCAFRRATRSREFIAKLVTRPLFTSPTTKWKP